MAEYPFMDKWGRDTARSRYGKTSTFSPPEDASTPQKAGDKNNLRGPLEDHPNDWVRGAGENATQKPGFDRS